MRKHDAQSLARMDEILEAHRGEAFVLRDGRTVRIVKAGTNENGEQLWRLQAEEPS